MFFNLGKDYQKNFPNHFVLPNNLILNTDDGWQKIVLGDTVIILKGYSDKYSLTQLASILLSNSPKKIKGNFCAFVCDKNKVAIKHDKDRGFPIWFNKLTLNNLEKNEDYIAEDWLITVDGNMDLGKQRRSPHFFSKRAMSDVTIIEKIDNIIRNSFERFLSHNTLPLKIFLSGGIDSLLAWAYLDSFTKNYEIVDYEHIHWTYFYSCNQKKILQHQLYNQIHLWEDPCVLVTGSCGDEYFMRGPRTASQVLKFHGVNLLESVKEDDYMWKFLNRETCKNAIVEGMRSYKKNQPLDYICSEVLNRNKNDHQHWHLDNTLTFTPFKDIDITEYVLQSSVTQLQSQATSAYIQKKLVENLDPTKLKFLTKWKNWYDDNSARLLYIHVNQLKNNKQFINTEIIRER